ncbi:GDP-mannose-dependent alpha-mannosyltransferase [Glutamicibacter creatinolyticus]|uniref:D-inositol 3-phosphate glycosyltransferase n=1 Tax=Glutamicibacter creatinolyticus TaxID=162496 RepID=A0A5B7WR63_9MICC|nr:GDP-mannose-dependent alpha-mannosyltransferase [Glutamicibacter creatinolyticus]
MKRPYAPSTMGGVKVSIVAESFLPHTNGVTNSVLRTLEHLRATGHEAEVIAPAASHALQRRGRGVPGQYCGFPVRTLPSMSLASYPGVRLAAGPVGVLRRMFHASAPDVVHLASPFVLGWRALRAAGELGLPTVAVYQTEVPAYARPYRVPWLEARLWEHVRAIHLAADLTLAPSTFSRSQLQQLGVGRVKLWRRGVDTALFTPVRRNEQLRQRLAPGGQRIIGYVGRLAAEKQVGDLRVLAGLPGTRLVIVGDGPLRESLQQQLPGAVFPGFLRGIELAEMLASLDLFVHPGQSETFCQTIQEAMASAVPVVAVGRGGPVDLVSSSHNGWLYQPGNLMQLRSQVADLIYDDAKRAAFSAAALESVQERSWGRIGDQLLGHYVAAAEHAWTGR